MARRGVAGSPRGTREFLCSVVSETVGIRLRRAGGFDLHRPYFVQCDQAECQYVDENKPPCPLHAGMFAEQIEAAEAERRARHE